MNHSAFLSRTSVCGTIATFACLTMAAWGAVDQTVSGEDDPAADGWTTEVFSNLAKSQLDRIGALLLDPTKVDADSLRSLAADKFVCGRLRPAKHDRAFEDSVITVDSAEAGKDPFEVRFRGVDGLAQALRDLAATFADATELRFQFKIVRVQEKARGIATRQHFSVTGLRLGDRSQEAAEPSVKDTVLSDSTRFEQHSTWDCLWTNEGTSEGEPPRLRAIVLREHEQVISRAGGQTLLADCTAAILGHNACFQTQLMHGTKHWLGHIPTALYIDLSGYHGLAVGDVNGDGLEDVYVCQDGGLPNRLFVQNLDGSASDQSSSAGVDWLDRTHSALLVDLDNDQDQDLVIGVLGALLVMSNDGAGSFELRGSIAGAKRAYSLCAADHDDDGDLDIYVCRYDGRYDRWDTAPNPIPYHDANNGARNVLLRNDGDWQFKDVTTQVGLDTANERWSFAASWEDYDDDGDVDLYVANDFGRNCLYRNDRGRFVNVAAESGVEDVASGMSACWGDYNRDGRMDLYVANMFSSAGGRIAYQRQFGAGQSTTTRKYYQRMARGNTLFANQGNGRFADVSVEAGATMGRWAWGSIFVDLNNDGWEDLLVANGFFTSQDADDL